MKKRVLFLCTGNSARSQMAEALLGFIAIGHCEAHSAGTHPAGMNPMTLKVMEELGMDVQHCRSKNVTEFLGQSFDYVVTVCDRAKETCPVLPGVSNLRHWSFEDPAAASEHMQLEVFRRVRDEIADRLCAFISKDLQLAPSSIRCYRC